MKTIALFLIGGITAGQEALQVGQPVSGEIQTAETRAFKTSFAPGDYVSATLSQRGASEPRRQISFVAETGGDYRIELVNVSDGHSP